MIRPSEFIHPEDAAALRQLESIPGFPALVKKFYALGLEQYMYGVNMASAIRLSPTQLPDIYWHLPPICEKLGIAEPEFYLQMDPAPNAWTSGDTRIFITVTSGLMEMMDADELDAVIAHECGHILCRHVLYHSVADYIVRGIDALGILGSLATPVKWALLYWSRKSELSCDRCAGLMTSPLTVSEFLARFAGGPKSITEKINMEEWARQAEEYEKIRTGGAWNRTLQVSATLGLDHPFNAVRVREILKWGGSDQYENLVRNLRLAESGRTCPHCGKAVSDSWTFCKYCGTRL